MTHIIGKLKVGQNVRHNFMLPTVEKQFKTTVGNHLTIEGLPFHSTSLLHREGSVQVHGILSSIDHSLSLKSNFDENIHFSST